MPKIRDITTWQQAEQLMQPAFIRLIDNIRKQLDESSWKGTYEDVPIWAENVGEEVKQQVTQLRAELEAASPETAAEIEQALAQLPAPYPGYQLCLSQGDHLIKVDLWELCYQICFQDYDAASGTSRSIADPDSQGVRIDPSLFDQETGEVDWNQLDQRARQVIEQVFADLPK